MRTFKTNPKTGELIAARMVDPTHELMLISEDGIVLRTPVEHISLQGRSTQGVTLMDVEGDDRVAAVAVIDMEREYDSPEALPTGATVAGEQLALERRGQSVGQGRDQGGFGKSAAGPKPSAKAAAKPAATRRRAQRRPSPSPQPETDSARVRASRAAMGAVADRLRELGIELPARRSYGKYVGAARAGDLVFVSGAGPDGPGRLITGKVGADVDIPKAQEAARLCVINCLSALQEEIGDLENVTRIVKLLGFVNSAPGSTSSTWLWTAPPACCSSCSAKEASTRAAPSAWRSSR